jgi:cytochrome c peroxidase
MQRAIVFGFLQVFFSSWACQSDRDADLHNTTYSPTPVQAPKPHDFPPMVIPKDNPLSAEGIALGKKLFFDPILSRDSSVSCGTCHQPNLAFTDALAKSKGIKGRLSPRSAMSLLNVGFYSKGLFWDGRVATLEEQSLHPVRTFEEMGESWARVSQKLQVHAEYPILFRKAFGITRLSEIDSALVGKALAQFERTLISADTKFDRVMAGKETFSPNEKRGWTIFFDADAKNTPTSECNHCHVDPLFSTLAFENNGIEPGDEIQPLKDLGRGGVTGNVYERGQFRVPTLRNLAYTAPYMHDGRFKTLDEVLDHYQSGGHAGMNVSPNVRKLQLNKQDRRDLLAFLQTLNDDPDE